MGSEWLVYLIFAAILGFIIAAIVMGNPGPAEVKKHWTPHACEVPPGQKWYTKY